jgi:hypothetical protein
MFTTSCVGNYWPIGNGAVTDLVGGKSANSTSPVFVTDRFGIANGAIRVNNSFTAWKLPSAPYVQGATTITLWVLKNKCIPWAPYGNNFDLILFD